MTERRTPPRLPRHTTEVLTQSMTKTDGTNGGFKAELKTYFFPDRPSHIISWMHVHNNVVLSFSVRECKFAECRVTCALSSLILRFAL